MILNRVGVAALVLLGLLGSSSQSFSQVHTGQKPFSTSAAKLRAAATKATADPQEDVVVLLEGVRFVVRNKMVVQTVHHQIVKVQTEQGVRNWAYLARGWAPWFQERPLMEARVLDADGNFHGLDTSTIELVPQPQGEDHTYSDWRELRAPLAAVHPGSVIETLTTLRSARPYAKSGNLVRWYLGNYVPTLATHIVIDSDRKLRPKIFLAPKLKQVTTRKGRGYRYAFNGGRIEPYKYESGQPYDKARIPMLLFSTGGTWRAMASEYQAVIDGQVAKGKLPKDALPKKGKTRDATIAAALAKLHKRVRYTGLEFGKNAIVPWTPAETWQRQFGDCKDKATILVAMLRSVGIRSHVALLRSGGGFDVDPRVPGMGSFNHAIVYVPSAGKGQKSYWIDATSELATLGQVGKSVQGRLALIAGTATKKLVKIPIARAMDNRIVEERKIVLPGYGQGSIWETTHFYGTRELNARYGYRDRNPKSLRKDIEEYVADHYEAPELKDVSTTDPQDLHTPLRLSLNTGKAGVTYAGTHEAGVYINRYQLFDLAPSALMVVANEKKHLRPRIEKRTKPLHVFPFHKEWQYAIHHPPGYEAKTLPRDQSRMLGAVRFQQHFRAQKGLLHATFSVSLDKSQLSATEVNETRAKIADLLDGPSLHIRLHHDAMSLWERGKVSQSLAMLRNAKNHAQSRQALGAEDGRLVQNLLNLGLNSDAQRIAKKAGARAPKSALLAELEAYALEHSSFGLHLKEGSSRDAALLAYERALSLAPDNDSLLGNHGKLLMQDAHGRDLEGDLEAAIPRLRAAMKAELEGYANLYVRAMYRAGHYKELLSEAKESESNTSYAAARVATSYHSSGIKGMLLVAAEADIGQAELLSAIHMLVDGGQYAAAQALVPLAKLEKSPWLLTVEQLQPMEPRKGQSKAKTLLVKALYKLASTDRIPDELVAKESEGSKWRMLQRIVDDARSLLPAHLRDNPRLLGDLLASKLHLEIKAKAGPWQQLAIQLGDKGVERMVYLGKRGRKLQLLCDAWYRWPIAQAARHSLDRGKTSEAQQVLQWATFTSGNAADKWGLFSTTHQASRVAHSLDDVPLAKRVRWHAAALIVGGPSKERTSKDLSECVAEGHAQCAEALLNHHRMNREFTEGFEVLEALDGFPKSAAEKRKLQLAKLNLQRRSGDFTGSMAAAATLSKNELLSKRQLADVYFHWSMALSGQGHYAEADRILRQGKDAGVPVSANNLGWQQLFIDGHTRIDDAIAHARSVASDPDSKHTLATLLAAKGEHLEAMQVISAAQELRGKAHAIDYVVYGRVAADLGFTESARQAYRRVIDDPIENDLSPVSTRALAKRWLKELPAP